jgi:hypothetical protein
VGAKAVRRGGRRPMLAVGRPFNPATTAVVQD